MPHILAILFVICSAVVFTNKIMEPPLPLTEAEIAQELIVKEQKEQKFMAAVSPPGATDFVWLGNSWFEYCYEGVKIMEHYRNRYREGYMTALVIGECY